MPWRSQINTINRLLFLSISFTSCLATQQQDSLLTLSEIISILDGVVFQKDIDSVVEDPLLCQEAIRPVENGKNIPLPPTFDGYTPQLPTPHYTRPLDAFPTDPPIQLLPESFSEYVTKILETAITDEEFLAKMFEEITPTAFSLQSQQAKKQDLSKEKEEKTKQVSKRKAPRLRTELKKERKGGIVIYKCSSCSYTNQGSKQRLEDHITSQHEGITDKYRCLCGYKTRTLDTFNRHIRRQKRFQSSGDRLEHKRIDTL